MFALCLHFCRSSKEKRLEKALNLQGDAKLTHALDTRTIVKYHRAIKTFFRLVLSKTSRELIHYQRRYTVIEASKEAMKGKQNILTSTDSEDAGEDQYADEWIGKRIRKLAHKVSP